MSISSGKIVGKWEGRPTVFQSGYQGAFPLFFPEEGRGLIPGKRGNLETKNHVNLLPWDGIGIANVSMHTVSHFFSHRSSAKNFSSPGLG